MCLFKLCLFAFMAGIASFLSAQTVFVPIPSIGSDAPEFLAATAEGKIAFPKAFQGRWVVFFSFPNVFMSVCTSEIKAFLKEQKKIDAIIVGISANSSEQHSAWMNSLQKETNETKGLLLASDSSKRVLEKYGMIQPLESKEKPVRAVYFIDPKGKIRAVLFYPLFNGRSLKEIARLLASLQIACRENKVTPADWQEGQKAFDCPKCKSLQNCRAKKP